MTVGVDGTYNLEFDSEALLVEGVVIEARDNQAPVVEFRTREGQRVRNERGISASPTP